MVRFGGARALGKDQDARAAVSEFAGEGKALAESGTLRQRKDVEQRRDQQILKLLPPSSQKKPVARRTPHLEQQLAAHGRRQAMTQPRWQRKQNETDVDVSYVIGDQQQWPACAK